MSSRIGFLREKLDNSGINGNEIISDNELDELLKGLKFVKDCAADYKDMPFVYLLSIEIERITRVIDNR